ncbi:ATP-binding protein [Neisseria leonii]|uniref:ATP-binding protein n=1 Tax=Neisseria leonii TaxID=2995413 RepID=A0A9X4IAV4_9NEIS|nr:ATP-binding protein [Neisseria sp. 51.81]MDD9327790.1 ATP-binding protein [Neisseria sp. 51.81]
MRTENFKTQFGNQFSQLLINIKSQYQSLYHYKGLNQYFEPVYELLIQNLNLSTIDDLETSIDINLLTQKTNELITYLDDFSRNNLNKGKSNNNDSYYLRNLINGLEDIIYLLNSSELLLFNGKILVLTGQAGSGKSHLLADFVQKRQSSGKYALLLLGQDFTEKSNVWNQIFKQLNLNNTTPEAFLSALNSIGEMQKERVALAIDALNEGEGKSLWNNQLNGFIELVSQYSNIGLVISVRDSYKGIIFNQLTPENKEKLYDIHHTGFMNNEFEAIQIFFPYYGLQLPNIPLLNPEFSNPLYLKLFCESLKYQGKTSIPKGHKGFDCIVKSYLDGIEKYICGQIEQDIGSHLVKRAINVIAKLQLEEDKYRLDYITVKRKVSNELKEDISESDAKKFLDYLIKENVISKNTYYDRDEEYIYFNYERIGDYQKANLILKHIHNQNDFIQWLNTEQGKNLHGRVGYDKGVWEALSVLLPEQFDFELFEVIDYSKDWYWFEIIVKNLFWRQPEKINMQKLQQFFKNNHCFNQVTWIDILYQLATEINHPLNIKHLHNKLHSFSLADRDAGWTAFIALESYQCQAIERLLTWCHKSSGQENIKPEALLLGAIAVSWLFTSTDRRSRNKYINALTHLLWNRLGIALELFKEFKEVNDPYVMEGILSAIYGATIYSENLSYLKALALEIDNRIFNKSETEEIYSNVLVRDYARYIIEYSLKKDNYSLSDIDSIRTRITPPYRSSFPNVLPINEEIDKKYHSNGQKTIIRSMTTEYGRGTCGYGDFGRYTFEAQFYQWKSYKQGNIINVDLLSNYACQMIFEHFGYDDKKHLKFDKETYSRYWRRDNTNKIERIGKKYQWLALYEILARVMDNFPAFVDSYSDKSERAYVKNLDGFYLPKTQIKLSPPTKDNAFSHYKNQEQCKTKHYFTIQDNELIDDWVKANNFPDIGNLLELTINGEKWLALERHDDFREMAQFGQKETYDIQKWLQIRSYLVKESQYSKSKTWLAQQNFMGRWMPEGNEYYGANIHQFFAENTSSEWQEIFRDNQSKPPLFKVIPSVDSHTWESTYGNDGISFYAPNPIIYHGMKMQNSIKDGYWIDSQNNLICFNPQINDKFQSSLLVKKDPFLNFLKEHKLKLIWTVLGEKTAYRQSKFLQELSGVYYLHGKYQQIQGSILNNIQEIPHWGSE